ncbi:MAG: flap endonuclease-1 [Methanobacteriota archaeon]|nr:MAG: flap endonuclease-1 [Euryarchaeota archaeon]|tara:strand:- start:31794 stop:32816 length:1023 start_codon:yes stop_codon:yes gene_type:complete
MGCNLKDLSNPVKIDLNSLKGKKIGIDAFLVAFQFLTSIRDRSERGDGGPLKDSKGRPVSHLMGFLDRTTGLLEKGIIPVFIFDGVHPDLKAETIASRKKSSIDAEKKWKYALENGDYKEAQKWAQRCVRYTPEMVEETIEMLHLLGVPAFRAAAEGEAQAAVMAAKGDIDLVATQDWDALLYGSPILIRNIMSDGSKRMGRTIKAEKIVLQDLLTNNELTREELVDLGIMIGTDFHPGIKGIGPKTGLKLIKKFGNIENICAEKNIDIPENLNLIREIFLNHPVNDNYQIKLNPINLDKLRKWLLSRDFSNSRIDRNFKKLEKSSQVRDFGQASLSDYF